MKVLSRLFIVWLLVLVAGAETLAQSGGSKKTPASNDEAGLPKPGAKKLSSADLDPSVNEFDARIGQKLADLADETSADLHRFSQKLDKIEADITILSWVLVGVLGITMITTLLVALLLKGQREAAEAPQALTADISLLSQNFHAFKNRVANELKSIGAELITLGQNRETRGNARETSDSARETGGSSREREVVMTLRESAQMSDTQSQLEQVPSPPPAPAIPECSSASGGSQTENISISQIGNLFLHAISQSDYKFHQGSWDAFIRMAEPYFPEAYLPLAAEDVWYDLGARDKELVRSPASTTGFISCRVLVTHNLEKGRVGLLFISHLGARFPNKEDFPFCDVSTASDGSMSRDCLAAYRPPEVICPNGQGWSFSGKAKARGLIEYR